MKEGISIKEVLLGVELYEVSNNFMFNLRESRPNPSSLFKILPEFTLTDKGNIVTAEWYHQFIGCINEKNNKKYTYLNLVTNDSLLLEEVSNCGYEDLFEKDLDMNKILSMFGKQKDDDISGFVFPVINYLIVEIKYVTTYDHFNGGYDSEGYFTIVGYLDEKLERKNLMGEKQKYFEDDDVTLPFDETGTVKRYQELLWGSRYWVKIRKSNGFNKTNEIVDFFEHQIELEIK